MCLPKNRKKFNSNWDEINYLHEKIIYWLYMKNKPYKAKLMQTSGGIGDDSLIVPGTPEMDMGAFEEVYNSLKDKIKNKKVKSY